MRGDIIVAVVFFAALLAGAGRLSADAGLAWQQRASGVAVDLRGVAYGNGRCLAVGMNGTALLSADGAAWSPVPAFTDASLRGAAFGNGVFVAVSGFGSGDIWHSADASSWTKSTWPGSAVLTRVRFMGGDFFAVGQSRSILTSSNGAQWRLLISADYTVCLYDIARDGARLVAVGQRSNGKAYLARSTDGGLTWQEPSGELNVSLSGVAYGAGLFVAVGGNQAGNGVLLTSADGLNWSVVTEGYEYIPNGVVFEGGLFLVFSSALIASPDGAQWTEQQTPIKPYYGVGSAQGRLLAVGHRGAILQSDPVRLGPSIFANGAAGELVLNPAEPVAVAVALRAGQYENLAADWWVLALPEGGSEWYCRTASGDWSGFPAGDLGACRPAYQGPLATIAAPTTVLSSARLAAGGYRFYFLVDREDGVLNYPDALYDAVRVEVR